MLAFRFVTFVLAALFTALLPAQDLRTVDFDGTPAPWTGSKPTGWALGSTTSTFMQSTQESHCGNSSCLVHVGRDPTNGANTGATYCEIGKQWFFPQAAQPTQPLVARIRVKKDQVPPGARIRIAIEGIDQAQWTANSYSITWLDAHQLAGSSWVDLDLNRSDWQEFDLAYRPQQPTGSTGNTLVRFWITAFNANNAKFYVDSVDFTGSSVTTYGGTAPMDLTAAHQVTSSQLSIVYDSISRTLRELRGVVPSPVSGKPIATGPNRLSSASPIYTAHSRTNLWSNSLSESSSATGQAFAVTALATPESGWRITKIAPTNGTGITLDIFSEGGKEIFFRPAVTRPTGPNPPLLEELECPTLNLTTSLTSFLAMPTAGGSLIPLDASFVADVGFSAEYPGNAALQLMALYDQNFGVGLAAFDEVGENKTFIANTTISPSTCTLRIKHRVPSTATGAIATFKRALLPCIGDWRDAAEGYRNWASTTERWASAKSRPNSWIHARPTILEANLQPQGLGAELVPLAFWPTVLNAWRSQLNGPMVPLFRSFESHGTFIGPNYLPLTVLGTDILSDDGLGHYPVLHSESAIMASWQSCQQQGHYPMIMVAGLKWAADSPLGTGFSRNEKSPRSSSSGCSAVGSNHYWVYQYSTSNQGTPWSGIVVKARPTSATTQNDLYVPPAAGADWDYGRYVMDPRDPFAIQTHLDLAKKFALAGGQLYLFDQMNGGSVPDNFDPARGPVGAGPWKTAAIRNLFSSTLNKGRQQVPDFELAIEDPCEVAIDIIAVHGMRCESMRSWPAPILGNSEAIPMFAHVYSEVVSLTSWDNYMISRWMANQVGAAWRVGLNSVPLSDHRDRHITKMARNLVSGAWLSSGIIPWQLVAEFQATSPGCSGPTTAMWPDPAAKSDIDSTMFLMACVATSQGPASSFFRNGRLVRTLGFSCGQISVIADDGNPIAQPLVHHCALEMPGTHICALILANVSNAQVSVALPSAIGETNLIPGAPMGVFINGIQQANSAISASYQIDARTVVMLTF